MFYGNRQEVRIEPTDQCDRCQHFVEGLSCPLLEALAQKVVVLTTDELIVKNCGQFKEKPKPLSLLPSSS